LFLSVDDFIIFVILKPGAVKRISRFKAFSTSIGSSQDIIKQAYKAAFIAARDEQQHGALPFLVYASEGPDFSSNSGLSVCTTPLGYSRHISSEQDARSLVWACLRAVQVLHEAGLVHSDIRLSNTVWLNEEHCMIIDLEHCRKANKALPDNCEPLKEWDDGTLELTKKKKNSLLPQISTKLDECCKSSGKLLGHQNQPPSWPYSFQKKHLLTWEMIRQVCLQTLPCSICG